MRVVIGTALLEAGGDMLPVADADGSGATGAENCPRTAPGTASEECTSAKKPDGLSSILFTVKP